MLRMKNPCIVLEGIVCEGAHNLSCPRAITLDWREIWLERVGGWGAGGPIPFAVVGRVSAGGGWVTTIDVLTESIGERRAGDCGRAWPAPSRRRSARSPWVWPWPACSPRRTSGCTRSRSPPWPCSMDINDVGLIAATVQWRGRLARPPIRVHHGDGLRRHRLRPFWFSAPLFAEISGIRSATPVVRLLTLIIVIDGLTAVRSAALMRTFQQNKLIIANSVGLAADAAVAISLAAGGAAPTASPCASRPGPPRPQYSCCSSPGYRCGSASIGRWPGG